MISFLQMASAVSGAGGGEDPLLSDKESPTALTSDTSGIESSEQAGESEGELKSKPDDDDDALDEVDATDTDKDRDKEVHEEIIPERKVNKSYLTPDKRTTTFDGAPRPGSYLQRYFEDSDFSRESSADIDSLVHAQLDSDTSPSPNEKSWDEELRESLKEDKELHEIGISAEGICADSDKLQSETQIQLDTPSDNSNQNAVENVKDESKDKNSNVVINVQETEKDENGNVNTLPELNKESMMPETREDIDGKVSPSLMFASCRYRWEKAILTQSPTVVFVTINKKEVEPIKLSWSDTSSCYYSEEFKIPVGTYVGHLVIDGNFYPTEDITIKHYTFEVDLYLKEEIIEDEQQKSNGVENLDHVVRQSQQPTSSKPLSTEDLRTQSFDYTANRDYQYSLPKSRAHMESDKESIKSEGSGINLSSKYQDLVRSQMSNKNSFLDQDSDNEVGYSMKSDLQDLENGRRSPVGEDGTKQYQDGDDTGLRKFDMSYSTRSNDEHTSPTTLGVIASVDVDITTDFASRSPDRKTTTSVIDDVLGNGHSRTPIYSTETPVHSRNNSAHSSARHTPLSDTHEIARPESVNSGNSANSVSRHLIDDLLHDALGRDKSSPIIDMKSVSKEGSVNGSLPKTPPPEQIDDVLNPSDRHSPIRREYLNGSPRTSNPSTYNSAHNSAHSSQRQTPQKEIISNSLHTSQEKLYSPQEIRKLSYDHESPHSSHHSSQKGSHPSSHHSASNSTISSRPQSLTSEQELTQYYENGTETQKVQSSPLQNEGVVQHRTSSASSLPVIGTQRHSPEKRSMTPDNHIRIPGAGSILKGPLLPGRTTPRTPMSNASSRTVTPVNTEGQDVKLQEQIRDLENTISNLRRLLANREQEVVEVKGQFEEVRNLNQKLQGDVDRLRARASPGPQIAEMDRKYREVLDERDRLSSEIGLLREELRSKEQPSLNSYDPNSPAALQRKIDDLTSQIQDLQEAHETTVAELSAAENKVKELAEDNEKLRIDKTSAMRDVEDNNRLLKSEVARLKENRSTFTEATEHRLKIELQQVKDDNRNLRERNYQLHDDNIKLKQELMNLRKSFELMDTVNKTYKEEKKSTKAVDDYIREDRAKHLESSYHGERESRSYRKSDPISTYKRTDPLDETENLYNSYTNTSKELYDLQTESLKADRMSYDLDHDLGRRSNTDHLSRSDGGRYKSGSYGNLETDRLAQSESLRYASDYRSMPDGVAGDRLRPSPPKYESRSLTPERLSTLNLPKTDLSTNSQHDRKKYDRLDRSELEYVRKDRSRTSSAEIDFHSLQPYPNDAQTKTMPILSGRSKEIYAEITNKRLKERHQSLVTDASKPIIPCESEDNNKDANKTDQSQSNNPTTSNQVFVNRYIPQTSKEPNQPKEPVDESKLLNLDRVDVTYTRSTSTLPSHSRLTDRDEKDESKLLNLDRVDVTYTRSTSTLPSHSRLTDRDEKDYDVRVGIYQDDGDMSDTATDILVNAQPLTDKMSSTWNKTRVRRGSLGSDGSDYSDIDEQLTSVIRKRSKSADGREVLRRIAPTGSSNSRGGGTSPGKGERPLSRAMSPGPGNAGFRSITPRTMATQHNKTTLSIASSMNTLTQGLRPFAPRSPQDLQVNDVIKFSRQGGKLSQGTIKFIGHLPGRGDIYLGVELDKEEGKHDGVFEGIRYFKCKPSKGVFVAYNKVVMAWTTY